MLIAAHDELTAAFQYAKTRWAKPCEVTRTNRNLRGELRFQVSDDWATWYVVSKAKDGWNVFIERVRSRR